MKWCSNVKIQQSSWEPSLSHGSIGLCKTIKSNCYVFSMLISTTSVVAMNFSIIANVDTKNIHMQT
jgi:hypothetical protein